MLGQKNTLLESNSGSRSKLGERTVTQSKDVFSSVNQQSLVNQQTSSSVLLFFNLGGQVSNNWSRCIACCPNQHTIRNSDHFSRSICRFSLSSDGFRVNFLDHSVGFQVDVGVSEHSFGVVNQLLVEHVQHVWQGLDQSNFQFRSNFGHPGVNILVNVISELTSNFNTGWATATNDNGQQSLSLWVILRQDIGSFDEVHESSSDFDGVADFLQEVGVFCDTRDTKSGRSGTNTNNQVVVVQRGDDIFGKGRFGRTGVLTRVARVDSGGLLDGDSVVDWVDVCGLCLQVDNLTSTSSGDTSHRLNDGSGIDSSSGHRGQQWGEKEVVTWGNNNNVVQGGVQVLQERDGAPARTQKNQGFLFLSRLESWHSLDSVGRVRLVVDFVANITDSTDGGQSSQPSNGFESFSESRNGLFGSSIKRPSSRREQPHRGSSEHGVARPNWSNE
ncbi:hypothetical protein CLUG_04256 [Clavispora lusitaniae ATCC 42720]|uniref:Uncharacterized protein n=1 Tax=Clavispora lusitaniae (strain ATCC 42720) TaxID=306902 RepID=C4Y7S8_CLAL4|nr:uncharacterized protein CLUG_04256 [Clavispora lusitaniae ATCC 42720]EEQ40129.1 hypothetical protein CLUG_04256 [Clavispora lusitaniae ATCC 42720]